MTQLSLLIGTTVQKWIFNILDKFLYASTRGKELTITIVFTPDKLVYLYEFEWNVRVFLCEQNGTQNIRPKNGT